MNIANQGFPATRADINNALQAIATNNSGTSAPSTTFANQWFYNETSNKLFIRNEANNAFIEVATLDQTNNEWQITTGQISAGDGDGLVFKTDDGNTRITLSDGGDVTFADGTDIITASAGTDNVRIGEGAGDSIASGGNQNVVIGKDAGTALTTGDSNTFIGAKVGDAITTSSGNVAIGGDASFAALGSETQGKFTTAIGVGALRSQNFTSDTQTDNTAVGYFAGGVMTTGTGNTFVGALAGDDCVDGVSNVAVGKNALSADAGNSNTAVGESALISTTGANNTAIGSGAGHAITTGSKNSIIGMYNGNGGGLDIRTSSNFIVLSDGDGNPRASVDNNGTFRINKVVSSSSSSGFECEADGDTYITCDLSNGRVIYVNGKGADGNLIELAHENTTEGTISVSGTTVSYNGGHLSRWSRLTSNNKDTSIVKGTVMTNLDEMVVWSHDAVVEGEEFTNDLGRKATATADDVRDAYTEDNEQLNCMAVSSIEGDPNVAGVFVNWDESDDYNDMNIAMTGDMVIRIAKDTTVARGDLLISAGDGTAKPQGDDIVRSKTIAKVTSINVSHTYDDESYLVPCVLMAC